MSSPVSSMALQSSSEHGGTVLVEGKLLSGSDLLHYAQQKGLCTKCVQHVTHKRVKKRLGMLRSVADWIPITSKDDKEGNYTVYKGFCLQPTCWTLTEVQAILGETSTHRSKSVGRARATTATPLRGRPSSTSRTAALDDDATTSEVKPRELLFPSSKGNGGERARCRASLSHYQVTPSTDSLIDPSRFIDSRSTASSRDLNVSLSKGRDQSSDEMRLRSIRASPGGRSASRMGQGSPSFRDSSHRSSDNSSGEMNIGSRLTRKGDVSFSERNSKGNVTKLEDCDTSQRRLYFSARDLSHKTVYTSDAKKGLSLSDRTRDVAVGERKNQSSFSEHNNSSRRLEKFFDYSVAPKSPYYRSGAMDVSGSERSPASFYSRQSESDSSDDNDLKEEKAKEKQAETGPQGSTLSGIRSTESSHKPSRRLSSISHGPRTPLGLSVRNMLAECRSTSSFRDLRITGDNGKSYPTDESSLSSGIDFVQEKTTEPIHMNSYSLRGSTHSHTSNLSGNHLNQPFHTPSRRRSSVAHGPRTTSSLDLSSSSRSAFSESRHASSFRDSFHERSPSRHLVTSYSVRQSSPQERRQSPSPSILYNRQGDSSSSEDKDDVKENLEQSTSIAKTRRRASLSDEVAATEFLTKPTSSTKTRRRASLSNGVAATDFLTKRPTQKQAEDCKQSPIMDRAVTRRAVPDLDILQHLCSIYFEKDSRTVQQSVTSASAEILWTSLHTRYGDIDSTIYSNCGKTAILANLLKQTDNNVCIEACWALLSYTTKQEDWGHRNSDDLELKILNRIVVEFDRQDVDFKSKKYVAETICNMIEAEKLSLNKSVSTWLKSMPSDLRYHWISVLFSVLLVISSQRQRSNETAQILFVISSLFVFQTRDSRVSCSAETNQLFRDVADFAIKTLSTDCLGYGSSIHEKEKLLCENARLSEASLSILASVMSPGALSTLSASSLDCMNLILEVMEKHTVTSVMYQGALATRQVFDSYWFPDEGSIAMDTSTGVSLADKVVEIAMMALMFEKQHSCLQLAVAACRLITLLLEKQYHVRRVAEDSIVLQRPIVVETIVRIIDTSDDACLADESLHMLLVLVTKHPTSGRHLRQIRNIASKLVDWMVKYNDSISLQEFICLIVEYLVASEDHLLGQEVGRAGGLGVLSALVRASAKERKIFEAASRALVGVIAVVDKGILFDCNVLVASDIGAAMSSNALCVELQLAGLNVLHCLCLRADSELGHCEIVVPVAVKAMENHFGNVDLLTKCCTILRIIASKLDNWTVIIETGGVKRIINAMLVHPLSTELILEGMATIKDLAAKESCRDQFNHEDAELAVVSTLPVHIHNAEVLSLAFATLNNIAVDSRCQKVAQMNVDVFQFLRSALAEFPEDFRVTRNACLLLKSYTYDAGNLDMMRSYRNAIMPSLCLLSESPNNEIRERAQYIKNKF